MERSPRALVSGAKKHLGIEQASLGQKGKHGILKSMQTREQFLTDPGAEGAENNVSRTFGAGHRITVSFTPRHASWLRVRLETHV